MSLGRILRHYKNSHQPLSLCKNITTVVELSVVTISLPIKWLTDKPVWVGQFPMTSEKLEALEQLAQEQLNAEHRDDTTSHYSGRLERFLLKYEFSRLGPCLLGWKNRAGKALLV